MNSQEVNRSVIAREAKPFGVKWFDPEPFGLELMAERLGPNGVSDR